MESKFYKISRTLSYWNDETEDIITDFKEEYLNSNRIIEIEVLETYSINAVITEYIAAKGIKDLIDILLSFEELTGECFTISNEKGDTLFTEEHNLLDIGECSVCKKILLPDDELYSDENTSENLCDTHSNYNEETGGYYKSREQKTKADRKAFVFLAKLGCVLSTDEDGRNEIQRIDEPEEFAKENDLKFIPERLKSDDEAKAIFKSLTHNQILSVNLI